MQNENDINDKSINYTNTIKLEDFSTRNNLNNRNKQYNSKKCC